MAITVQEERGQNGRKLTLGRDFDSGTRLFIVKGTGDPGIAVQAAGLPQRGDRFPNWPGIRCRDISATTVNSQNVRVIAKYDNRRAEGALGGGEILPGTYHITVSGVERTETALHDLSPLYSSYGAPSTPQPIGQDGEGVDVVVPHVMLNFEMYWEDFDALEDLMCAMLGTINNAVFRRRAAWTLLCRGGSVREFRETLNKLDLSFEFNPAEFGWHYQYVVMKRTEETLPNDAGKKVLLTPVLDNTGSPVTKTNYIYPFADFNDLFTLARSVST